MSATQFPRRTRSMVKNLALQRPIVTIDLETTGLNVNTDRIVEISCVKLHPDNRRESITQRLNPNHPIHHNAYAVHGITNSDVAECPTFADLALDLLAFLSGCDLSGFNIERYDLPLLKNEFSRVNIVFPQEPVHVLDSLRIFKQYEPHDLSHALRFYCNRELQNAHSAEADANAAADILLAQVRHYDALPADVPSLSELTRTKRPGSLANRDSGIGSSGAEATLGGELGPPPRTPSKLDPDGKIIWHEEQAVFSFGRHRLRSLQDVQRDYPEYLGWITRNQFSPAVMKLVTDAMAGRFPVFPVASVVCAP